VGDHDFIPQLAFFQVAHQVVVDHGELARQIGLDVQVAVVGFYARRDPDDVRDGCRGGNGYAVGVAHAVLPDVRAQGVPIKCAAVVNLDIATALLAQQGQCVLRQNATIPQ